ncbi:MAG: bifunctional hydroxymethylpyrimidine kinase/phosphomethylpyrimidine kinase [Oscillospiraceae bacterium]|nr:bifunctional hydroxymethylpyrimidine kinase/phosphomethylpyrimidine kinase [Oscillospiraceae bacterium]
MKKVLTIAGSDCSGGAGIQADIKTITAHKMYAMSAITALTAQNTTGVSAILEATPEFVAQQLDSIFTDIRPDAVKIGMVSNKEIIEVIASKLKEYEAENIVVDPVMVATSGSNLLKGSAAEALVKILMPLATVVTPNIPEAEVLSGIAIGGREDMLAAAKIIGGNISGAVLVKGGHFISDATDLLFWNGEHKWFAAKRIDNPNTHGTGCTLSSAIACALAAGLELEESIYSAKKYLSGAISAGLDLGKGSGPLDHTYALPERF